MYLMYVDESGDSGLDGSPSDYYVLSGLVLHELRWQTCLDQLIEFRKRMRQEHGLLLYEEIHAARMINRPGPLVRIKRHKRLAIIRAYANELATIPDLSIINIVVTKQGKALDYDVFEMAWRALIQRFENTLGYRNFPGPANPDERGLIIPDHTQDTRLVRLLRRMHRWNPVQHQYQYGDGYRNLVITRIIEDPSFRDSTQSYFVQSADVAAFLLYQKLKPNSYMREHYGHHYFQRLDPVLCKQASSANPQGLVEL